MRPSELGDICGLILPCEQVRESVHPGIAAWVRQASGVIPKRVDAIAKARIAQAVAAS